MTYIFKSIIPSSLGMDVRRAYVGCTTNDVFPSNKNFFSLSADYALPFTILLLSKLLGGYLGHLQMNLLL
jgi:hypothetical protein